MNSKVLSYGSTECDLSGSDSDSDSDSSKAYLLSIGEPTALLGMTRCHCTANRNLNCCFSHPVSPEQSCEETSREPLSSQHWNTLVTLWLSSVSWMPPVIYDIHATHKPAKSQ